MEASNPVDFDVKINIAIFLISGKPWLEMPSPKTLSENFAEPPPWKYEISPAEQKNAKMQRLETVKMPINQRDFHAKAQIVKLSDFLGIVAGAVPPGITS